MKCIRWSSVMLLTDTDSPEKRGKNQAIKGNTPNMFEIAPARPM